MSDQLPPIRVGVMLGLDERLIAQVNGVHESGVLLTNRRLLAWRANGVSPGLQLSDLDRLVYDRGVRDALLIVPSAAAHGALALLIDPSDRSSGEAFMIAVLNAVVARARARGATVAPEVCDWPGISMVRFDGPR
jgi:hypothetical protein